MNWPFQDKFTYLLKIKIKKEVYSQGFSNRVFKLLSKAWDIYYLAVETDKPTCLSFDFWRAEVSLESSEFGLSTWGLCFYEGDF